MSPLNLSTSGCSTRATSRASVPYLVKELDAMGYQVKGANGAYYIYVKAPGNLTDVEFADIAADNGVIIVPGRSFSASLRGYVRLSYGAEMATLEKAMKVFRDVSALHN